MSTHQSHQRVRPTAVQALPSWDTLGDLSGAFRGVPGMVFAAVPLVPRASLVRRPPVQPGLCRAPARISRALHAPRDRMGPVAAGFLLSRAARARRAPTPRQRCFRPDEGD
jgi:hypothetical protein